MQIFDSIADSYDRWYDEPDGRAVFNAELQCLRPLCRHPVDRWLEAGVGTGRFASSLGIANGMDPSVPMLRHAAARGIRTCAGRAESIPFPADSFDGVLLALTLCFIADPQKALNECSRILRPGGSLLLGIIPADSPWGRAYEKKKKQGRSVYAYATFYRTPDIVAWMKTAGLELKRAASTLFWSPEERPETNPRSECGMHPEAGFLGLLFEKNRV